MTMVSEHSLFRPIDTQRSRKTVRDAQTLIKAHPVVATDLLTCIRNMCFHVDIDLRPRIWSFT